MPQIDDINVFEVFENLYFSHHCLAHVGVFVLALFELLDGNDSTRLLLLSLEELAIRTLSNNLQDPVVVHLFILIKTYYFRNSNIK